MDTTNCLAGLAYLTGLTGLINVIGVEVACAPGAIRRQSAHKYVVPSTVL